MKKLLKNDWEFNILNIYNYNKRGSFSSYFDFIKKNHKKLPGDLLEAASRLGEPGVHERAAHEISLLFIE